MEYLKREILHTGGAVALAVLLGVATELSGIESFESVTLAGLALTAVRTAATALVAVLTARR